MRLEVEVDASDDELPHITTGIVDGMEMMGFRATVRRVDRPEGACTASQSYAADGHAALVMTCDRPAGHGGTIHHDPKRNVEWRQTQYTMWGKR